MALSALQRAILAQIARNRSPASHFAGGTVMNADTSRQSEDFDIFHSAIAEVQENYQVDVSTLRDAGFSVQETPRSRPANGFIEAEISLGGEPTIIQWVQDTACRFFPVIQDPLFGWRLHDVDLAINKVLAMAGRREARDYYDVVTLIQGGTSLLSLVWAAPAKDPGFTPELLLDEMTRHSSYTAGELRAAVAADPFPDLVEMKRSFLKAVDQARTALPKLPMKELGKIYLDGQGRLVDPAEAKTRSNVMSHEISLGGSWPNFPEAEPEIRPIPAPSNDRATP